jgi:hypothetical protein
LILQKKKKKKKPAFTFIATLQANPAPMLMWGRGKGNLFEFDSRRDELRKKFESFRPVVC